MVRGPTAQLVQDRQQLFPAAGQLIGTPGGRVAGVGDDPLDQSGARQLRQSVDTIEQEWRSSHPDETIVGRHIGTEPVPATASPLAVNADSVPETERSATSALLSPWPLTTSTSWWPPTPCRSPSPPYNFGVSQNFKTWVDLVITDPGCSRVRTRDRRHTGRPGHCARRHARRRHPS
jgi:hypothetical protein